MCCHLVLTPAEKTFVQNRGIERTDPSRQDTRKPFAPGPEQEQMEIIILESEQLKFLLQGLF